MPTPLPRPEGLIFDLDGTLADTLEDLATAINLTRRHYGIEPLDAPLVTAQVGSGTEFLVRRTVPVAEAHFAEAHALFLTSYDAHVLDQTHLHNGVAEVLAHFSDRKLGVITNKPARQTEKVLAGLGVRHCFAVVVGGDTLPEKKPHPLPVLHFLRTTGLSPDRVVMIGDGVNDIRAGKAAGVATVGVTFGVSTLDQMRAEAPDHIIGRMEELLGLYL